MGGDDGVFVSKKIPGEHPTWDEEGNYVIKRYIGDGVLTMKCMELFNVILELNRTISNITCHRNFKIMDPTTHSIIGFLDPESKRFIRQDDLVECNSLPLFTIIKDHLTDVYIVFRNGTHHSINESLIRETDQFTVHDRFTHITQYNSTIPL